MPSLKNMNKGFIFFTAMVTAVVFASGQVIQPADQRTTLLDDLRIVVENTDRDPVFLGNLESPFVEDLETTAERKADSEDEDNDNAAPVPEVTRALGDAVALRLIAQQFKPIGSLILGERAQLQLANGTRISAGDSFNATIQGTTYEVLIESVTSNGYTLRIGEASISKTFNQTRLIPSP